MRYKANLICIGLLLLFLQAQAQLRATQQQYQLPLLIGKDFNPVLRLLINTSKEEELKEVTINIPDFSSAIDELRLFAVGQDSTPVSDVKLQRADVFAKGTPAVTVKLKGSARLKPGANYFWLTAKLKPNADLQYSINTNIRSAQIGPETIPVGSAQPVHQYVAVALRQHNQENVHTHRIPGLATAKDGTLLAIYDARRTKGGDLQGDIDIGLSRSTDKGRTWLPMQVILDMGEWGGLPQKFNGVSDANILVDQQTGDIFVAGLWMYGVLDKDGKWTEGLTAQSTDWNHQWRDKGSQPGFDVKQTAQFMITKSSDHGKTWSKPVNLTKMCKKEEWWLWAPAPGAGITLKDRTLVFPTQGRDAKGKPFSNITYSKDHGQTWHTSNAATSESTTENMAVELSDGSIMLNMRANSNRTDTSQHNGRAIAVTHDLGESWTIHPTSHQALQEPTCMASIIRHDYVKNGRSRSMLIFCNPDSKTARDHISLKVSDDDGKSWQKKILLDVWKGRGYSCLTSIDQETIGVLYESSQADLVFQAVKIKDLL